MIFFQKKTLLARRQRGPIRSVLLVIIGWLVGFLRNGCKDFSDFLDEVRGL